MGLSKNITLTIKDYEIKLDKQIKFYENDTIDLCFSILEYGIEVKDGVSINKLMPIQALTAYMLIETPQGVDYAESTKIEDNKIVFNLGAKYSQFVGIGRMQIVIKDSDGCRVTLPEFEFEIKRSINTDWDREFYFLSTEDDSIITDEFGRKIHMTKISDMPESENLSEESYTMIIDEEGNKRLKVKAIVDAVEDSLDTKFNAYTDEISGDVERIKSEINELKEGNVNIDLTNYATKTELSLKVDKVTGKSLISDSEIERLSALKNYDDTDIKNTLSSKADKSELHSHSNKSVLDGITSSKVTEWNNKSTFDGNYNSLTNKPTIPTLNGYATEQYVDEEIKKIDVTEQLTDYAKKSELHSHNNKSVLDGITSTKITEWNNKSNFSGSYNDLTNKPTIPTLNGYATEQYVNEEIDKIDVTDQLTDYAKKSELHSHSNKSVLDGITSTKVTEWDSKSTFSGNYNNLTNKPTIPTKTSQLTNDSGFITSIPSEYVTETELSGKGYLTSHQDISGKADKSTLTAHTSDTTSHITATERNTWNAKSNLALGTTSSTAYRGDYGNTAYTHSQTTHAPSNAQKNSDITKAEIEAKLTGNITSHTHSQYLTSHQDLSDYALKTEIPNKTSQLVNDNNFLTSIPSEYVTETELNTAFEQFNPGSLQQIPLYANSIEECTDTTKCYVLPDGFIYAYKETTVEIETPNPEDPDYDPNKPLYTNVFEVDGYTLNKRWSYSGKKLSDANGHVISGYIPVKVGDVVRVKINNLKLANISHDYNRVHFFDSNNTYASGHRDSGFDDLLKITAEGENTYSFVVGYVNATSGDDSTNHLIEGANDIAKMMLCFHVSDVALGNPNTALTDEDYKNANVIVTINQEIKEPVVVPTSKNLVDTATYYLNARYNSSNTLKQTDAEISFVAFDYIEVKKGDILRFKSTVRGYHNLGGSLLLWGMYPRLRFFNANNQLVASGSNDATPIKDYFKLVDEGDNTTAIYVGYKADGTLYDDADQIAKTRFTIQVTDTTVTEADMQNIKITVNTPMSELDSVLPPEGNTQVVWQWSNTGHAFVPNENYDELIANMKNITDEHSKDIVYLKAVANNEDSTSGLSDSEKIARVKNWDMPIYENAPIFLLEENKPGWATSNLTNDKLIEMYDTLMNNNSHYITKEDLGFASDGTTHLYAYHFREPEPHQNGKKGSEKKPVILICSGIHPTERAGEWSMYYALEEITNNLDLDDLKRNVHFIIMPLINPTAVNDTTWGVRNPDGIQTHYQFEVDFNKGNASPGERNYGGEQPLTIPESIAFDNLMKTYKNDLAIVMSCHNCDVDTQRGTDFIWCSCPTNFATNLGYRLADKMSKAWHKKHGTEFEEGVRWANAYALQKASEGSSLFNPTYVKERPEWDWRVGQAGLSGSGGTEYKQALKYGVQGINVEVCSRNMVMDKSFTMTWSSNVMTWGCETYVNFFRIFMAIYDYKDKEKYYKK